MKPPQHRADAPPILILRDDPAWDFDRISDELKDGDGEHPVEVYFSGASRYDVATIREYLDPDAEPTEYRLRRLPVARLARVQDMFHREVVTDGSSSLYAVWVEAVTYGLESIDGPGELDLAHRGDKLSTASIQAIHDERGGLQTISEIGAAIFNLSQPPNDREKKR